MGAVVCTSVQVGVWVDDMGRSSGIPMALPYWVGWVGYCLQQNTHGGLIGVHTTGDKIFLQMVQNHMPVAIYAQLVCFILCTAIKHVWRF